ncbi:protein arginine methyltransferase NDUFAF7 homolog, mitochondrial isoform X3 [Henckelia pumila]|uniref:protein arginine methyltransferase NDUFAF7 homolog, mitochondrial isoform X3 n=1 Tax=Henckelia pumila TaxID=405737 RepID=UPI003C6DE804
MAARRASSRLLPYLLGSPIVIPASPAYFSTQIVGESPVLVRDFIHAALYDPKHGYFSQRSGSVGVLDRSIKFNELQGRKAYVKHLDKIYKQSDISWFTPVELFKPWYARGIAEAILRTANLSVPLKIYEIGGGSGTCAKGVMDYMKLNAPTRVYDNMAYISVEISSSLAKKQLETVGEVGSHLTKFKVECRDAADSIAWGNEQQPCWVIMLEVLDNLPHDLIYSENQVSTWMEVWVGKQHGKSELCELYKPLEDPLITSCMEVMGLPEDGITRGTLPVLSAKSLWSKIFPKPRRCWLPTGCLKDGSNSDYNNYLDAKGDADIFFPTDFGLLERMDHYCSGWLKPHESKSSKGKKRRTITLDASSFMDEFGLPSKTRTKDGYNPMLDDFKNTKFYLSVPTHNTK